MATPTIRRHGCGWSSAVESGTLRKNSQTAASSQPVNRQRRLTGRG
ncbi:hypothetical protein [Micromonospora sp. WMMD710]|nr:hypothetical protein [Micromonospora sp. WMMD710]MDG4756673.1 hypothetical protein [Micromonospora sp. WMMD710]